MLIVRAGMRSAFTARMEQTEEGHKRIGAPCCPFNLIDSRELLAGLKVTLGPLPIGLLSSCTVRTHGMSTPISQDGHMGFLETELLYYRLEYNVTIGEAVILQLFCPYIGR